jgi:hypothetical protein
MNHADGDHPEEVKGQYRQINIVQLQVPPIARFVIAQGHTPKQELPLSDQKSNGLGEWGAHHMSAPHDTPSFALRTSRRA